MNINNIEITEQEIIDRSTIPKLQVVYFLVSLSNKGYVGSAENAYNRLNIQYPYYEKKTRSNRPIEKSIRKYKWINFKIYLLHVFEEPVSNDEMLALETAYIEFFKTTDRNIGYNVCLYANNTTGTKLSEEQRSKISQRTKGENNPRFGVGLSGNLNGMWGKHHSEETKQKIKDNLPDQSGENHPMWGKHHSQEAKEKISLANLGRRSSKRGIPMTNEQKYNLSQRMMGRGAKPIKQLNKVTNEIIKIWKSAREASKELDVLATNITHACKNKSLTAGGFKWEYAE